MIVMKFGGSSVGKAERIRTVLEIVKSYLSKNPVVVVSAHKGVTDMLIRMANDAVKGVVDLEQLTTVHNKIMDDLGVDHAIIQPQLEELATLLKGISMVKELTLRTLDYVCSFGERLSSRTIADFFNRNGLPCEQHDAYDIGLLTDDNFGSASPLPEADVAIKEGIRQLRKLPIITGYIGMTKDGSITTLGRDGSDYSASIIGAAIGAEEIQIWTDVDGVMTADPSILPEVLPLDVLTFEEASELAYYGAKVLHPATIIPAMKKGIPVRVLNTFKPRVKGTVILPKTERSGRMIKSIVYKEDQYIVNIVCERMLMGHGYLARIFDIFASHRVVLNMVTTSEISVSVTTDSPERLELAVRDLSEFATVSVEKEKAMICVIGEGMKETPGIAADIFAALKSASVNVLMISQGASKINIALMIDNRDIEAAVRALHKTFF